MNVLNRLLLKIKRICAMMNLLSNVLGRLLFIAKQMAIK